MQGLSHFVIITSSAKTARRPNWCSKTAPSIFLSIVVLGTEVTLASSIDSERSVSRGMPQHCCVPLCSSNSSKNVDGDRVGFHSFPSDPDLLKRWIINIRRDVSEHFSLNAHTKVCSLHFEEDDFHPGHERRDPSKKATTQLRRKLKPTAVPTVFAWSRPKRKPPTERSISSACPAKRPRPCQTSQPVHEISPPLEEIEVDGESSGRSVSQSDADAHDGEGSSVHERTHAHCECVDELKLQVELLEAEKAQLQATCDGLRKENDNLRTAPWQARKFSIERVKDDDKLVSFYTGFSSYLMFLACFNFLKRSAEVMRGWKGSATCPDDVDQHGQKPGRKSKLSLEEQFFLVMVRLRLGLFEVDLADRFGVHPSTVSRIIITWLNLMYVKFQQLPAWLSRRKINRLMPPCFKKWYPTTRVIIDCTEFFINTPSSLARQSATWSSYKEHNTVKCLIGIAPHGHVTFVSPVFEGSISDRAITEQSNLLELLERGDSVMADKGFDIQDILITRGVKLNIPPFKQGERQMLPEEIASTKKIAAIRIHVERKMQRIKSFRILSREIDNSMFDCVEQLVFVCAMLTNFQSPLVS